MFSIGTQNRLCNGISKNYFPDNLFEAIFLTFQRDYLIN